MTFKLTTKNRLIHVSAWTICVLYFAVSYFLSWWDFSQEGVDLYEPAIGALSITACCYLIYSTLQFYLPRKNQYVKIILIRLTLTVVSVGLSIFFLNQFFDDSSFTHFYEVLPHRFVKIGRAHV